MSLRLLPNGTRNSPNGLLRVLWFHSMVVPMTDHDKTLGPSEGPLDLERVRDLAIAMVTQTLFAWNIKDPEESMRSLTEGLHFVVNEDVTDAEFSALPSVLVQMTTMFMQMVAILQEVTIDEVWQWAVPYIRNADLHTPGEGN